MSTITKTEKSQRLPKADGFPGIKSTPGVCGGDPCIRNTRIPVHGLVELKQLGCDDAKLFDAYPTLTQSDLDNAWEYARAHPKEIQRKIAENNADEDKKGSSESAVTLKQELCGELAALPFSKQKKVLEFARSLKRKRHVGVPASSYLPLLNPISSSDLAEIKKAIDEGCEGIDPSEW
jgi:uncharacterized protein (DUF433 family)